MTLSSRNRIFLGVVAVLVVAVGGLWYMGFFGGDDPRLPTGTPVTIGEGSILITTHRAQPFYGGWDYVGGSGFNDTHMIKTKTRKSWKRIFVNTNEVGDCTGKNECRIEATFSDGTKVTLSHEAIPTKGMQITSTRMFGEYAASPTALTCAGAGSNCAGAALTLSQAILTTRDNQGVTNTVDLCHGVSRCQATAEYK